MNVRDMMRIGPVIPVIVILPNIACVGGSRLTPEEAVVAGEWGRITALAREASNYTQSRVIDLT